MMEEHDEGGGEGFEENLVREQGDLWKGEGSSRNVEENTTGLKTMRVACSI